MLGFAQHKQSIQKVHITKLPHIGFGVSLESPQIFIKPNTMISTLSYVNPYVNLNSKSEAMLNIPIEKRQLINNNSSWTHRIHLTNFSHINNIDGHLTSRDQEKKIANELNQSITNVSCFSPQAMNNKKLFNLKKGEFTQYLQNHLANIDFTGPILGNQRTNARNAQTKINILKKKFQNLQNTRKKYQQIGQQYLQSRSRSPSPLLQKTKIRRQRQKTLFKVGQTYSIKQNIIEKSKTFQLPKINRQFLEESLNQLKQNYSNTKNQNLMTKIANCQKSNSKLFSLDLSLTVASISQASLAMKNSSVITKRSNDNEISKRLKRQTIRKIR